MGKLPLWSIQMKHVQCVSATGAYCPLMVFWVYYTLFHCTCFTPSDPATVRTRLTLFFKCLFSLLQFYVFFCFYPLFYLATVVPSHLTGCFHTSCCSVLNTAKTKELVKHFRRGKKLPSSSCLLTRLYGEGGILPRCPHKYLDSKYHRTGKEGTAETFSSEGTHKAPPYTLDV